MSSAGSTAPHASVEKPPVEPGCLPAWDVGELPAPVPFQWRNLLALIGPGIVMIGGSLGTGEWIMGPAATAKYGGAMLWVAPLAILCQVWLNTEAMRYTLITGEPVFTGFLRSKPGPRFWLIYYLLLDCMSWWPALAGLAAQIILFTLLGSEGMQSPAHSQRVQIISASILILCVVLLCFGGKVFNMLEKVLSVKVFLALGYTLFVAVFLVPWDIWQRVLAGMFNPFIVPRTPDGRSEYDWAMIAALVGYAGVGGMGNLLSSNYVREKGWGMGAIVGAIPSAFGGQKITLSHLGTMAQPTPDAVARFKHWWHHIRIDQYGIWAFGSVMGMLLPCIIGAAFLQSDYIEGKSQWEAAARLAIDLGNAKGEIFTKLMLLVGFTTLFPGQLSSMDGIARRWCDALWSGSRRIRELEGHKVKNVYYTFVVGYAMFGLVLISLNISPPKMMVISANMANLMLTSCIVHTLYTTTRFLPVEFRPSMGKRVLLGFAATFYAIIFGLVTNQTIERLMAGTLFS